MPCEIEKIKECLGRYSNIIILAPHNKPEILQLSGGLLLILKKLSKNATLLEINSDFPEEKQENKPSADQADFLISIKEGGAKLSRLFYEKNDSGLNLFLKTDGFEIKKEDVLLQPLKTGQMIIAIGIGSADAIPVSLKKSCNLILNINSQSQDSLWGDINIFEKDKTLPEIVFEITKKLAEEILAKETAASQVSPSEKYLFEKALDTLRFSIKNSLLTATLSHLDFLASKASSKDIRFALSKICSGIFPFQNFLLLWEQNSSPLSIWGVFYSKNSKEKASQISALFNGSQKNNSAIFNTQKSDFKEVENLIISQL